MVSLAQLTTPNFAAEAAGALVEASLFVFILVYSLLSWHAPWLWGLPLSVRRTLEPTRYWIAIASYVAFLMLTLVVANWESVGAPLPRWPA